MKLLTLSVVLFVVSQLAFGVVPSNPNLGNGLSVVTGGYNTGATGIFGYIDLPQAQHDIIIGFCDSGNADVINGKAGNHNTLHDTMKNTYLPLFQTPVPWLAMGDGLGGQATANGFMALDVKAAGAYQNELLCDGNPQKSSFADVAWVVIHDTNPGTHTFDAVNQYTGLDTPNGSCPLGGKGNLMGPLGVTTTGTNELIVGLMQNNGAGPTGVPSPWIFGDGVGYIATRSLAAAGPVSLSYCLGDTTTANLNSAVEMVVAIGRNGGSVPPPPPPVESQVSAPAFSVTPGFYGSPLTVGISSVTAGATIRYSLSGAPTCTTGTVYAGSLSITSVPSQVQAIACEAGMLDSTVTTQSYSAAIQVH